MDSIFRHVGLFGKYHTATAPAMAAATRAALEEIAQFLASQGCQVVVERDTAANAGLSGYPTADVAAMGTQCDLGLVVGGDGTMLGIGRQLACHGVPLIGVNQGRLGFITDIPLDQYRTVLPPMLAGEDDAMRDEAMAYAARLAQAGVSVRTALVPSSGWPQALEQPPEPCPCAEVARRHLQAFLQAPMPPPSQAHP